MSVAAPRTATLPRIGPGVGRNATRPQSATSNKPKVKDTEEVKQQRQLLRQLRAETINEKKLLNDQQQQKEKIEIIWEMGKKRRDEGKMELRHKLRQKQDLEEKHNFELTIYKEKVKHLLHEQQSAMTDVKLEAQTSLALLQEEDRDKAHDMDSNNRMMKVVKKEPELKHIDLVKSIKQDQEKAIMAMRQEFERRAEEMKKMYEKKVKMLRDAGDEKRKEDTQKIEMRKAKHIQMLMIKHHKAFEDIKKYYQAITHTNLDLIKNLKEDVADMKKKEQGVQKEVNEIRRKNKKLSKPLQENLKLVDDLQAQYAKYEKERIQLGNVKQSTFELEERLKNLQWEREVLEQKSEVLKKERDELFQKREQAIYDVQQKSGFKNLLLEKKIEAMTQDLEKTESALSEVLASTNLQPEVIGELKTNLEDVLMAKNKAIQKLEDVLYDMKQRYALTIRMYEDKLREHHIPVEELGFVPARTF